MVEKSLETISFTIHKNFTLLTNSMSCSFNMRCPWSNNFGKCCYCCILPSWRFCVHLPVKGFEKSCDKENYQLPQLLSHLPRNPVFIISMPSSNVPWDILWKIIQPSCFMNEETKFMKRLRLRFSKGNARKD